MRHPINYNIDYKKDDGTKVSIDRKETFSITAASEIMAICCISISFEDLKTRLGNILVAESKDGKMIFARDLN